MHKGFVSFLLIVFVIAASLPAHAGIFEIGAQANYRKTNYDATHSEESETGTASLAYYFWEMSALEFSYTRGAADQLDPPLTAFQSMTSYGVDVLFTLADKESALKPYFKIGAAYVDKNLQYVTTPSLPAYGVETTGIALTAGAGLKLMITQQFAIKCGIDVSSSPLFFFNEVLNPPSSLLPPNTLTYDVSANAGISFLF
jgi:opacity protein-like surface antigen